MTAEPSIAQLDEWWRAGVCGADCPYGCVVEFDGTCEHGNNSWFIVLGLI